MSAHSVNRELGEAIRLGFAIGRNPGSGSTLDLEGKSGICFVLTTGTYKVPNATAFTNLRVLASGGQVSLTTLDGDAIASLINPGVVVDLFATSSSTWISTQSEPALPNAKVTTSSTATTVTPAASALTGARHVYWINTADGALGLTTPTAAALYAAIPSVYQGYVYQLTIVNRGDNTITITGGSDVDVGALNTVATLATRTYIVTVNSTGDVEFACVNKGTIET